MGVYEEKYTKALFTGLNQDGTTPGYGVEGYSSFLKGDIREIDFSILSKIDFKNKNVLEFGFGRGESIKYSIEQGALYYEGVNFSPASLDITREFLNLHSIQEPKLHCMDALDYLKNYSDSKKFDIVLMFDFVEYVPREELKELLILLKDVLNSHAIIVINTPCYRVDNDVQKEGLFDLNLIDTVDTSNVIDETKGMHCNLFTIVSLSDFMKKCKFRQISETHFFINNTDPEQLLGELAYSSRWEEAKKLGYPIVGKYSDDIIEYAFIRPYTPKWYKFQQGDLKNVSMLLVEDYLQYFEGGFHDKEMILHMKSQNVVEKVIFDVGGFMGVSSLLFANAFPNVKRIVCFEPNRWNCNRIFNNLSHNQELAERIEVFDIALGSKNGFDEMLISDSIDVGHSSTSQLVDSDGTDYSHEKLLEIGFQKAVVTVKTLESFIAQTGLIPGIIKVDIEGAEAQLLEGAFNVLIKYKPKLYIEFHSNLATLKSMRILSRLGYEVSVIHQEQDRRILVFCEPINNIQVKEFGDLDWLQFEVESLRASRDVSEKIIYNMGQEQKNLLRQMTTNYQTLNSTQTQLAGTQAQLTSTQSQLEEKQNQLNSTQARLIEIQNQLNSTQVQLTDTQREMNIIQTQLAGTQTQLSSTQSQLEEKQNQLNSTQTRLINTQNLLNGTQVQLIDTQRELNSTQDQLNSIINSASWKITKPIRTTLDVIKRILQK